MFGAPECIKTESGVKYFVKLNTGIQACTKYEMNEQTNVLPDLAHQETLQALKVSVLTELAKHEQLFKNRPKLESLLGITPNWGCILVDGNVQWSQHTELSIDVDSTKDNFPCYVDLQLSGLYISRSTITPLFRVVFLEKKVKTMTIDFDWNPVSSSVLSAPSSPPEVEEISDIPQSEAGIIQLRDPIAMLKAKQEAKEAIKLAFKKASDLHTEAVKQAKQFLIEFDIGDNESVFSEWVDNYESGGEDNSS